ncbi:hypothetical protein [Rugamonas sp. DEMB1]|uniref:hypothetical protein n=1 Tax=Rugamonas sp. DEMB1 TaxID=3039386 RepID=UPI0024486A79|nr:hypothetical protein [Rugamonas sp. DEMB1]WGG49984.1 hypothetical protein QC826_26535 [Rugamonas sp. DEMB1]
MDGITKLDQTAPVALDEVMDEDALQTLFAKTSYQLRESRKSLLQRYEVDSEEALLERIVGGAIDTHPAYEHYLSARIIEQTRDQVRAELAAHIAAGAQAELPALSAHLNFKNQLESLYAARLAEPVRMAQDALLLSFDNGLLLEVRYFSRQEHSIIWCWGEAERRLDTAPGTPAGAAAAAVAATADGDPWQHFAAVLESLLADPLADPLAYIAAPLNAA